MSKPAFTPGPWWFSSVGGLMSVYGKCIGSSRMVEGEFPICDIRGWGHLQYRDDAEAMQDANGQLIAAAPDLYAVLRELVDGPCATFDVEYLPLMRRVMAALTKAEGGEA